VQIGTGAAPSETAVISGLQVDHASDGPNQQFIALPVPVEVAASTRISCRAKCNEDPRTVLVSSQYVT